LYESIKWLKRILNWDGGSICYEFEAYKIEEIIYQIVRRDRTKRWLQRNFIYLSLYIDIEVMFYILLFFFKKKSLRFTTGLLDLPPYIDIGHSDSCDKRD
jgi:hypothetical protein